MIAYESKNYRIEENIAIGRQTGLTFAVDRKEKKLNHICLVNVGWYSSRHEAIDAMNDDAERATIHNGPGGRDNCATARPSG